MNAIHIYAIKMANKNVYQTKKNRLIKFHTSGVRARARPFAYYQKVVEWNLSVSGCYAPHFVYLSHFCRVLVIGQIAMINSLPLNMVFYWEINIAKSHSMAYTYTSRVKQLEKLLELFRNSIFGHSHPLHPPHIIHAYIVCYFRSQLAD